MTYTDQAALAINTTFRDRIKMSLVTAARIVVQDPTPDGLQNAYHERRKFAIGILKDPNSLVESASWSLASVPSITAATSDAALQAAVNTFLLSLVD